MSRAPAYAIDGRPAGAEAFYAFACDPRRNIAVEACAGAGKTWMLVSRIVRALLAGAQPQEILAITFTRRAAGEMRARLQAWLDDFAVADDARLAHELRIRGALAPGESASPEQRDALRGLRRRLAEGGRPVQVRTFHGWFAQLLRGAPLAVFEELGLPASYELLEDDTPAVRRVWRRFHAALAADPAARADYEALVARHGRHMAGRALEGALGKRAEFALADAAGAVDNAVRTAAAQDARFAGMADPLESLASARARQEWLACAAALGAEKNKTPQAAAQDIVDAFAIDDLADRFGRLRKALFVADADRLRTNLQRFGAAVQAEEGLRALCVAVAQHEAWLHQQRMARLTRLLLREFEALKRERGWVDMNDLERGATLLLGDRATAGWVLERLDLRVAHVLVDEFQDTNPVQWRALEGWLQSYAGAGGGQAPSVFFVGDPKQSIYRFRRAEPALFAQAQDFLCGELAGHRLTCDHTRRNAQSVIAAVNATLGAAQHAGEFEGFREHTSENADSGAVLGLPPVERPAQAAVPEVDADAPWRDSLVTPRDVEEETLRTVESRQAAAWVAGLLQGGVDAGDIMVLARKRDRLVALEEELRRLRIAAQQPERTELGDMPEVRDVIALLDVLVSPGHDLSLAQALRSPVFGWEDAELVRLATLREAAGDGVSWLDVLSNQEQESERWRAVRADLARWRELAAALPPHDVLASIYRDADLVAKFAAAAPPALRSSVVANLGALLAASLSVEGGRFLTPYALVRALKAGGVRAEPVPAEHAVRLLTIHGAKGLEAPVVLLLDTDVPDPAAKGMGVLLDWPAHAPRPKRFVFLASESAPPACCMELLQHERAARAREELNALYVAMTRAMDTLVLSSVTPSRAALASWWQRIHDGFPVAAAALPAPVARQAGEAAIPPVSLPDLPAQRASAGSLAPKTIAAATAEADEATRVGRAMHRLLERIGMPAAAITPRQRAAVAREFALDEAQVRRAAEMAQRIVGGDAAWAWDGAIVDWHGSEVELVVDGDVRRLDRLVRRKDTGEWWVLDYKSLWQPERDAAAMQQMEDYRRAMETIAGGARVRVAFVTAQGRMAPLA